MIYAYIDEQRVTASVVRLCHALGVSTSGYYARRQRGSSRRAVANEALLVHLRAIRVETHETYGSPRMHAELVARGQTCSVNRVARLMRLNHLPARHKRPFHPKTTCPDLTRPVAPNRLAQDFTADAPNQKWLGDITYIPTGQGWLYLAAVLDLHSLRIPAMPITHSGACRSLIPAHGDRIGQRLGDRVPERSGVDINMIHDLV